jgi:S1-C subfamily serine protease
VDPKADHYPFFTRGIPILVPHTGLHDEYHRPAAKAGLKPGDRLYRVNGRDFSGELELFERLRTLWGPLRLEVERDGRLRDVVIPVEAAPLPQAA